MNAYEIIATLITLTALASYINHRFLKMHKSIGLTVVSLLISIVIVLLQKFGFPNLDFKAQILLTGIQFNETFLKGMLGFMLFAGALHINVVELAKQKLFITFLATIGVLISTLIIGFALWELTNWLHVNLPLSFCMVFGALISPTDPIAVLGILKKANIPKSIQIKIAGESLFNDAIGIVLFLVMLEIAIGRQENISISNAILFFLQQGIGGALLGLILGYVGAWLIKQSDDFDVATLLTLSVVSLGTVLAEGVLHVSVVIAMVVSGLIIGNACRKCHMSKETIEQLDNFWELIDEVLNAVLFVLIGLEFIGLKLSQETFIVGVLAIPVVLFARLVSVGFPVLSFSIWQRFTSNIITILTWGGLRGGISIALALSLPEGSTKDLIVAITYMVVIFSILVQGLSIGPLVKRLSISN